MRRRAYSVIENPKSTHKEYLSGIRILPLQAVEPPSYWTKIANSRVHPMTHRRQAIGQLFRRHVKVGMPLQELAKVLDYPHWFRPSDLNLITELAGYLPVDLVNGDSTFQIRLLQEPGPYGSAIFLRIHKEVNVVDFTDLLRGRRTSIGRNVIAEVAVSLHEITDLSNYL